MRPSALSLPVHTALKHRPSLPQGEQSDRTSVPAILKPWSHALEALRPGGNCDMTAQLETLYAAVLWEALQQRPVALLLEDLHDVDDKSLRVVTTIAARVRPMEAEGSQAEERRRASPQGCGMMLCTSRTPGILGNRTRTRSSSSSSGASQPPANQRHRVICLTLEPLDSSAILEIALSALKCDSLAEPIAKIITGEQYPRKDASRTRTGHHMRDRDRDRDRVAAADLDVIPHAWRETALCAPQSGPTAFRATRWSCVSG